MHQNLIKQTIDEEVHNRMDARKWHAAKLRPKKYGVPEQVQVDAGGQKLVIGWADAADPDE